MFFYKSTIEIDGFSMVFPNSDAMVRNGVDLEKVFQWFWGKTTIGNDGFQWFCTIGPTMGWLCTIVEVYLHILVLFQIVP